MSSGYVWALYDTYDIFKVKRRRHRPHPAHRHARATTPRARSARRTARIVFTSVRDGDIELYRMDADGKNVKRLTFEPGYDGGAFFNADCTKIVWRASRPKPGKELDDFKALLAKGLVRPTKLELYVANADGSDAHQVTYLDAASLRAVLVPEAGPHHLRVELRRPEGPRVRPLGGERRRHRPRAHHLRQGLRRLPDVLPGRASGWCSRRTAPRPRGSTTPTCSSRAGTTTPPKRPAPGAAERIKADVAWLADPAREGRGVGHPGPRDGRRVHRGALQGAGPRAGRRERHVPRAVPGDDRGEVRRRRRS